MHREYLGKENEEDRDMYKENVKSKRNPELNSNDCSQREGDAGDVMT